MMERNKIYCIDVCKGLSKLEDSSIDIVITSPPYNLGNNHHTGSITHSSYNDAMPESKYQEWQLDILNHIYRVLKEDGSFFYNHKNRIKNGSQITPYSWILKSKFVIKQEIVWINRSQNFDNIRFYPFTERLYWLTKSSKTKLKNTISHSDVFDWKEWKPVGTNGKHTRQFPTEMVIDILRCFPDKELVLDPFMGYGTTAVACKILGKDFMGFEINKDFCRDARNRIKSIEAGLYKDQAKISA